MLFGGESQVFLGKNQVFWEHYSFWGKSQYIWGNVIFGGKVMFFGGEIITWKFGVNNYKV